MSLSKGRLMETYLACFSHKNQTTPTSMSTKSRAPHRERQQYSPGVLGSKLSAIETKISSSLCPTLEMYSMACHKLAPHYTKRDPALDVVEGEWPCAPETSGAATQLSSIGLR
eukprot:COSAG02_NODE_325_length_24616_cov_17.214667_10_plen_113_part_00